MDVSDMAHFEPLDGENPFLVMGVSIDGTAIIGQILNSPQTALRAAIWDMKSGKLLWAPENVSATVWFPDRRSLGLVYEQYTRQPELHALIGSPLHREYSYAFVRARWPQPALIGFCQIDSPYGQPQDVSISPQGAHVVILWRDQTEAGLSFIHVVDEQTLEPLPQAWYPITSDIVTRPVWDQDGKQLAFGWQKTDVWWASDPTEPDAEEPAKGGRYLLGYLTVLHLLAQTTQTFRIEEDILPGWLPQKDAIGNEGFFHTPTFTDPHHVTMLLPTGTERVFTLLA